MKKKPLLVYPRLSRYAETRNDHQVGTAKHFSHKGQLLAAFDEQEFLSCLRIFQTFQPKHEVGPTASSELLARLREFIAVTAEDSRKRDATG